MPSLLLTYLLLLQRLLLLLVLLLLLLLLLLRRLLVPLPLLPLLLLATCHQLLVDDLQRDTLPFSLLSLPAALLLCLPVMPLLLAQWAWGLGARMDRHPRVANADQKAVAIFAPFAVVTRRACKPEFPSRCIISGPRALAGAGRRRRRRRRKRTRASAGWLSSRKICPAATGGCRRSGSTTLAADEKNVEDSVRPAGAVCAGSGASCRSDCMPHY